MFVSLRARLEAARSVAWEVAAVVLGVRGALVLVEVPLSRQSLGLLRPMKVGLLRECLVADAGETARFVAEV